MPGPATPTTAPGLPRRSTTGCFSPVKPAPLISSRPRTAPTRPALPLTHALAAGDPREAALGSPGLPPRVGADRIKGRAGPFAEIELDQIVVKCDSQPKPGGDDLRALAGALQRARIERGDFFAGETLGHRRDFVAAALSEAHPRHAS